MKKKWTFHWSIGMAIYFGFKVKVLFSFFWEDEWKWFRKVPKQSLNPIISDCDLAAFWNRVENILLTSSLNYCLSYFFSRDVVLQKPALQTPLRTIIKWNFKQGDWIRPQINWIYLERWLKIKVLKPKIQGLLHCGRTSVVVNKHWEVLRSSAKSQKLSQGLRWWSHSSVLMVCRQKDQTSVSWYTKE